LFEDFRPHLSQPKVPTEEEILRLLDSGDVEKALKAIRRAGFEYSQYERGITAGLHVMVRRKRVGELLSILYKHKLRSDMSIIHLLRTMVRQNDIPGFLKQALRFEIYEGLEQEIDHALQWLVAKNQHASAEAYASKFANLRARSQPSPRD